MAEAIFDYGNGKISIQCGIDEKMEKIIDKFQTKIKEKSEQNLNLSYLYNANFLDKKLSFNEQANSADKEAKKVFNQVFSTKLPQDIQRIALRKLIMIIMMWKSLIIITRRKKRFTICDYKSSS